MRTQAWLDRLGEQLPGWHVWRSSPGGWFAVPAPDTASHADTLALAGRVNARTPGDLRSLCQERYGWHDYCQACGVLARECGHRRDETV